MTRADEVERAARALLAELDRVGLVKPHLMDHEFDALRDALAPRH